MVSHKDLAVVSSLNSTDTSLEVAEFLEGFGVGSTIIGNGKSASNAFRNAARIHFENGRILAGTLDYFTAILSENDASQSPQRDLPESNPIPQSPYSPIQIYPHQETKRFDYYNQDITKSGVWTEYEPSSSSQSKKSIFSSGKDNSKPTDWLKEFRTAYLADLQRSCWPVSKIEYKTATEQAILAHAKNYCFFKRRTTKILEKLGVDLKTGKLKNEVRVA